MDVRFRPASNLEDDDFDEEGLGRPTARIGTLADIAPAAQRNPFILSGYRLNYTPRDCLRSIFQLHNETLNIHTHLLPALLFLGFTFGYLQQGLTCAGCGPLVLFSLSATVCFACSSAYHTFSCLGHVQLASVDYVGICLFMGGILHSSVHYGFYCHAASALAYTAIVAILCAGLTVLSLHPRFHSPAYASLRKYFFLALALFALVPMTHWVILQGSGGEEFNLFFGRMVVSWMLIGVAFFFYVSKFPERCAPGACDVWFHSHQFWHVFVVATALWILSLNRDMKSYRDNAPCPAETVYPS